MVNLFSNALRFFTRKPAGANTTEEPADDRRSAAGEQQPYELPHSAASDAAQQRAIERERERREEPEE
jgi:hypothetical protein